MISPELNQCWAKTDRESGLPVLSVAEHCWIVGLVAEALWEALPVTVRSQLPEGSTSLAAAHDIGKLTPGFQIKAPKWELYEQVTKSLLQDGLCSDHAIMSQWHLQNCEIFKANRRLQRWLVSTGGHHGSYRHGCKRLKAAPSEGGAKGFAALRDELLARLIDRFGPLPSVPANRDDPRIHLLTGFTIFADWIGSNADWFPYENADNPQTLKERAKACLSDLRWNVDLRQELAFGDLFSEKDQKAAMHPRALQSELLKAADSPGLYIVEAPMGVGKTEAALATAYRRWTEGGERGLYFALPTQLTSNKIHDRIHAFLENALCAQSAQTLIHGNAWLSRENVKAVAPRLHEADPTAPEDDHNDINEPLRWFSSTRRQLLAPFGTGTIDQALLAVLPARFAALRYFALAGKVVVIDEVHSFDPYMSALVDRLVHHLVQAGGTVIVLSATLTAARRAELVAAVGAIESDTPEAYPLITKVATGSDRAKHHEISAGRESKTVQLKHRKLSQDGADAFWQKVAENVEAGANVVVIRNSVALAQNTYRDLKSRLSERVPAKYIGLLHSRFLQSERERNEAYWTRLLGKHGRDRPKGSLLVATQIVEQSVDIDADYLITDLAPTELILQRIGRLHRHPRARPEGFSQAVCEILHPETDWSGDPKTVKEALHPHNWIYPPFSLWQAAQTLSSREFVSIPGDIRPLLEQAVRTIPPAGGGTAAASFAEAAHAEWEDMRGAARLRGIFNASAIDDEEGVETRYKIKPTAQLIILPRLPVEQGGWVTWHLPHGEERRVRIGDFDYPLANALHRQAARIPYYLVAEQVKAAPDWLRQHIDSAVIATAAPGDTELSLYPEPASTHQLFYRQDLGLSYQKNESFPEFTEPDDYWF